MDNNIDSKKADNRVLDEVIVERKKKELEQIEDTRESFIKLSKSIERCIDLLDASVRKSNSNRDLEALRRDNTHNLSKTLEQLYERKLEVEKKYRNYKEEEE
jgi:hypothetical protein